MKTSDLLKGVVTLDEYLAERLSEKKPITNADRIRAMSDEELARFMWNRDIDIVEKACKATGFTYTVDMEKCFENVLNWLKQNSGG